MMKDEDKTKEQHIGELVELRRQVTKLEALELKHKRAEDALSESEIRYRTLFESIPIGIGVSTFDGKILAYNDVLFRMLGYSEAELRQINLSDIYKNLEDRRQLLKLLETEGVVRDFEVKFKRKDGTPYDVSLTMTPFTWYGKNVLLTTVIDISERKQAEEKLRESETKYKNLYNPAQVGLFRITIKDGKLIEINDKVAKLLGYDTKEECMADYVSSEHYLDPEARNQMLDEIRRTGKVDNFDAHITRKDGSPIWVRYSTTAYPEEGYHEGVTIDITEKKHAEEKLKEYTENLENMVEERTAELQKSEKRFRELAELLPETIYETDAASNITFLNRSGLEKFGYSQEDLEKGLNIVQIAVPEEHEKLKEIYTKRLRGEDVGTIEYMVQRKDGSRFPIIIVSKPILDDESNPVGLRGIAIDATERKRTEEALFKSEMEVKTRNKIANIFLTVPDDEMYGEVLKVLLDAMNSVYGVFGYIDDEGAFVVPSMTRHIWDKCQVPDKTFVFPRENWGHSTWPEAIRQKKTIYSNEPSTATPEGHIAISRHISLPIIHQEEVVGLIQVANKETDYEEADIKLLETISAHIAPVLQARLQRDRQEKERKRTEKALRESEELYRTLIKTSPDAVTATDLEGRITEVSERTLELYGFEHADEIIGKSSFEFIVPEDHEEAMMNLQKTFQGEVIRKAEYNMLRRDGSRFVGEVSASFIKDLNSNPKAFIATTRDITERKKLEEMRANFINVAAHELRTPVSAMKAHIDLLNIKRDRGLLALPDEIQEPLGIITRNMTGLITLINNLLDFTRLEAGTVGMKMEISSLELLASQAVKEILPLATKKGHQFDLHLPTGLPAMMMDEDLMKAILKNLFSNAIKYTPEGGSINIVIQEEGDFIHITVKDTGIGIPKEALDKIFQPFHVIDISGSVLARSHIERTGLGLAITKEYVKMHGGSIWAESQMAEGSTFHVLFPIKAR